MKDKRDSDAWVSRRARSEVILAPAGSNGEAKAREWAKSEGRGLYSVSFKGITDEAGFLAAVGQEFLFPEEATNLDAALDWLSDLEWVRNDLGYLWVLEDIGDLKSANPRLFESLIHMLPYLCDRWRRGDTDFDILITGPLDVRDAVRSLLNGVNAHILMNPLSRDVHPVPVIEFDGRGE